MTQLSKGANTPIPSQSIEVEVSWSSGPSTLDVDISALLLDASGKVRNDDDFVFYNAPRHASGAVALGVKGATSASVTMTLGSVEPDIERIAVVVSADGGTFSQLPGLAVRVTDAGSGQELASFSDMGATTETALVAGELYRRNGQWKFRAVGQGWASGLAGLATDFGISVSDSPADAGGSAASAQQPTSSAPAAADQGSPTQAPPASAGSASNQQQMPPAPAAQTPPAQTPPPTLQPPAAGSYQPQAHGQPGYNPQAGYGQQQQNPSGYSTQVGHEASQQSYGQQRGYVGQPPTNPSSAPQPGNYAAPQYGSGPSQSQGYAPQQPASAPPQGQPFNPSQPGTMPPPTGQPYNAPPLTPPGQPQQPQPGQQQGGYPASGSAGSPAGQGQPSSAPVNLDKGRVSLRKGDRVSLTKTGAPPMSRVFMGLGWDPAKRGGNIDLDASVIAYDGQGKKLEIVWFMHTKEFDGAIWHSGDNLTGKGDGDDEVINVDLMAVPPQVAHLVFTINSFSGQKFTDVANAYCRLVDANTQQELVHFSLTESEKRTGVVMAVLSRTPQNTWEMRALGQFVDGRTVKKLVKPAAQMLGYSG